jgi:hypothetical protein
VLIILLSGTPHWTILGGNIIITEQEIYVQDNPINTNKLDSKYAGDNGGTVKVKYGG